MGSIILVQLRRMSVMGVFGLAILSVSCGKSVANDNSNSEGSSSVVQSPSPPQSASCDYHSRDHWQFTQPECPVNRKVDFLFVIDSSQSMREVRSKIAVYIPELLRFLPEDLDFRVGVMLGVGKSSFHSGRLFASKNSPFVMDSRKEKTDLMQQELGQTLAEELPDSDEVNGNALLESLDRSLDPDRVAEIQAQDFYREHAGLAIVFITDEKDRSSSDATSHQVEFTYRKLKRFKRNLPLMLSAILPFEQLQDFASFDGEGDHGILDLLRKQSGSVALDIRKDPYRSGLESLKRQLISDLSLLTRFKLWGGSSILESSLEVKVDGKRIPVDYISGDPSIDIKIADAGHSGSIVDVSACRQ
jgi:hypothetical protein